MRVEARGVVEADLAFGDLEFGVPEEDGAARDLQGADQAPALVGAHDPKGSVRVVDPDAHVHQVVDHARGASIDEAQVDGDVVLFWVIALHLGDARTVELAQGR